MKVLHFVIVLTTLVANSNSFAATTVTDLRCEYLENPLGIDILKPRLSWILESNERGQIQTAYQILVASSESKLRAGEGDLWDTGKFISRESIQIPYDGKPLNSHDECFWKVRVWDKDDRASRWSQPSKWSLGLLRREEWKAKWIGRRGEAVVENLSGGQWIWFPEADPVTAAASGTVYFRRTVVIPEGRPVRRVLFQYTGDNECRGWFNGRDLGSRDNPNRVKFNDVTSRMAAGTNVIALMGVNRGDSPNPAGVVAVVQIDFADGGSTTIGTDTQWRVSKTEAAGWQSADFDDAGWTDAKSLGPLGMKPWGDVRASEDRDLPARYLRKEFTVGKRVRRAMVYYSGLGLSELYLNGKKVGDHVLSPAMSQYPQRAYYVTFDITDELQRGANALGVILGNGRFYSPRSQVYAGMPNYGFPQLLLHLRIEHTDDSISEIVSDETWKLTDDGPIRTNNEYDGEDYDARKEFPRWSQAGFNDSRWQSVDLMPNPSQQVSAQMIEPIRVTQTLEPVEMTEPLPGVYVFDLGQNLVGWCRLKVRGPAGTRVALRHAETLNADGTLYLDNIRGARVTDSYTLKGDGTEVWEPRFTYHGFRFVEVTGYPGKPGLDAIEGRVVHDDMRSAGEFDSSNPLLNRIYESVRWGTRGNYRSVPTDCPQRDERQGWLGDRSEVARGETYLFDVAAFHAKWLRDIADSQKESGSIPDVAPAHWPIYSDNVTWPSSSVLIPNTLLRQYGDRAVIARQYDSMKRWIEYMRGFMKDGLIGRDNYGDWCVPPEDPKLIHSQDPARITDRTLLASSYFYHDLRLMQRYAALTGHNDDVEHFAKLANELKAAFNARFLNRELGQYDNGTQTSCVLPLYFGLVPDDMIDVVFNHLVRKIADETHGHIGTGLIGGQFLNRVLSDHGRADLAYTIASQEDYPSWGYMVNQGATTIWELWNGNTADPAMNSGNHVMLVGDLVIWLYEYLAGIRPDGDRPAFKHIVMEPHPVGALNFVRATHRSPHGLIASEWKRQGDAFDWRIEVPVNTMATVLVPATKLERITEGGRPVGKTSGVEFVAMERDRAVLRVGSGKYHFKSSSEVTDQPGLLKSEFIYETAPYPSCHASTIAETKSGLIAAWFGGTRERHPDVGIWISSHIDGKWTTPVEVANGVVSPTNRYPTWNPVLFQPRAGPLMLLYKVGPSPSTWWGMMMTSEDDGENWSAPRRLPDGILGPIKNKPVQLENGDILSPSSSEDDGWRVHFERSSDLGKAWTSTGPVNDGKTIRAIQPSILFHGGGRLQALGRTRSQGIFEIWSDDNGRTWGEMGLTGLPNPSSGTDAVTLRDGRQLLVYNHNPFYKGRSPLNVAVSTDGKHWQAALVLEDDPGAPNGFAYPAVIQTRDGLVHVTYTWQRKRIRHVVIDPRKLQLRPIVNGAWPD